MTQNPYSPLSPPPLPENPQTQYEYIVQPKPPIWHKVIGIISIVLASLGIVCTPINLLRANAMNQATNREVMEMFPNWWQNYQLFSSFLGIGFSILLLVAGILLLRRRPAGRTLHLVYAGVTLVMTIVGTLIMVSMMNTDSMPAGMRTGMRAGMMIGVVIGVFFGSAYPIFLLIWFLRAKIRYEVASWPLMNAPGPTAGGPPMQYNSAR